MKQPQKCWPESSMRSSDSDRAESCIGAPDNHALVGPGAANGADCAHSMSREVGVMPRSSRYPPEVREGAAQVVREQAVGNGRRWTASSWIAGELVKHPSPGREGVLRLPRRLPVQSSTRVGQRSTRALPREPPTKSMRQRSFARWRGQWCAPHDRAPLPSSPDLTSG